MPTLMLIISIKTTLLTCRPTFQSSHNYICGTGVTLSCAFCIDYGQVDYIYRVLWLLISERVKPPVIHITVNRMTGLISMHVVDV